jgi:hypothetical protein
MTDNNAEYGTSWKRFAMVFALSSFGAAVLLTGLSRGALAASFTVSGNNFKVSADQLNGSGFAQFGGVDQGSNQAHPVAVNAFRTATMNNFCQSVVVPGMSNIGELSIKITAKGNEAMQAENLVVNLERLDSDLTLGNPQIGVDAGQIDKGPRGATGPAGGFGLQSDTARLDKLRQTAWSTSASTLRFNGMNLSVSPGRDECF